MSPVKLYSLNLVKAPEFMLTLVLSFALRYVRKSKLFGAKVAVGPLDEQQLDNLTNKQLLLTGDQHG